MTSFDGDKKIETKYTAEFVTDKADGCKQSFSND